LALTGFALMQSCLSHKRRQYLQPEFAISHACCMCVGFPFKKQKSTRGKALVCKVIISVSAAGLPWPHTHGKSALLSAGWTPPRRMHNF
jgi:hypothetical protein